MKFDVQRFYKFCQYLKVDTKDKGRMRLGADIKGSQSFAIQEMARGLEEDIHFYVILKGRQAMVTTIMEALSLYWAFKHQGLQGTLVTDTDETKAKCRSDLELMMESLPDQWRVDVLKHNRTLLELENRSRLFYQTAGTRGNKFLGQGKGINYCHSTETGSYGSEEGVMSLLASFASTNPNRLFVFESTAHGFNYFEEMWQNAKRAKAQRAIFIGWWRNDTFQIPIDSPLYHHYWDGRLTGEEKEWVKEVKKLYDWDINSRQIAWWRKTSTEEFPDMDLMYQNYPPTEHHAFIKSGSGFFNTATLTDAMKKAKRAPRETFRFSFGASFEDTKLVQATQRMAYLSIWERPDPDGVYVIGADPAYGSSDYADRFCIQVFKCYMDGMDQVAELATPNLESYQFAWALAILAGMYRHSRINLEVNSCGGAVINELKNLKRQIIAMPSTDAKKDDIYSVVNHIRFFMWQSDDNISGPTSSIGWMTNERNKHSMLSSFKDMFELKRITIRSEELINEMGTLEREDGTIAASGRNKDDRVMATGLAVAAYVKKQLPMLIQRKYTRAYAEQRKEKGFSPQQDALNKNVDNYLNRVGLAKLRNG